MKDEMRFGNVLLIVSALQWYKEIERAETFLISVFGSGIIHFINLQLISNETVSIIHFLNEKVSVLLM
jgi:hypothetical protein